MVIGYTQNDDLKHRDSKYVLLGFTDGIIGYLASIKRRILSTEDMSPLMSRLCLSILQDLSDSSGLLGKKPKEMKIILTFQPRSRVVTINDKENAVDEISHDILYSSSSSESDVHDTRKNSVRGGADDDLCNVGAIRASRRIRKAPKNY